MGDGEGEGGKETRIINNCEKKREGKSAGQMGQTPGSGHTVPVIWLSPGKKKTIVTGLRN